MVVTSTWMSPNPLFALVTGQYLKVCTHLAKKWFFHNFSVIFWQLMVIFFNSLVYALFSKYGFMKTTKKLGNTMKKLWKKLWKNINCQETTKKLPKNKFCQKSTNFQPMFVVISVALLDGGLQNPSCNIYSPSSHHVLLSYLCFSLHSICPPIIMNHPLLHLPFDPHRPTHSDDHYFHTCRPYPTF